MYRLSEKRHGDVGGGGADGVPRTVGGVEMYADVTSNCPTTDWRPRQPVPGTDPSQIDRGFPNPHLQYAGDYRASSDDLAWKPQISHASASACDCEFAVANIVDRSVSEQHAVYGTGLSAGGSTNVRTSRHGCRDNHIFSIRVFSNPLIPRNKKYRPVDRPSAGIHPGLSTENRSFSTAF